jgi:hypothetical protein
MPALTKEQIEALCRRSKDLRGDTYVWESHWQELADYLLPRKNTITRQVTKESRGEKQTRVIYDGTGQQSLEVLASALHGLLTPPSQRWFALDVAENGPEGDETDEDETKRWLEEVSDTMFAEFALSNFETEIHEAYLDLGCFGTSLTFVDESDDSDPIGDAPSVLQFSTRQIGEYRLAENAAGRIDTIFRTYKQSARQLVQRFLGNERDPKKIEAKVGKRIADIYKKSPDDDVECLHVVAPRRDIDRKAKTKTEMPFMSVYIDETNKHLIDEGGYRSFPAAAARWIKASGDIYGRSCGMTALPDVKVVNKMSELMLRGAGKMIDPPIIVPDDGIVGPLKISPGSVITERAGAGADGIRSLSINANLPLGLELEERRRVAIRNAFYTDRLLFGEGPAKTATEVVKITEEKMRLLGPVIGRLDVELLQPIIARAFDILSAKGRIPQPPASVQGKRLRVNYVSPLALAQKAAQLEGSLRALNIFIPLQQQGVPIFDKIDQDKFVDLVIEQTGTPKEIVRPPEEVQRLRDGRAKAAAQQAQMQSAMGEATVAKDLAGAAKNVAGSGIDVAGLAGLPGLPATRQ